jgi:hypothetical protein
MNMHRALRFGFLAVLATMIASTLALGATPTASVSGAIGDWEGKIDTGDGSLRVIVHISQAADGNLSGSLDSPDQGATGTAIDLVTTRSPTCTLRSNASGASLTAR